MTSEKYAKILGERARQAAQELRALSLSTRNAVLSDVARALLAGKAAILRENALDLEAGRKAGMPAAMLDRLLLDESRIRAMAKSVQDIARFPDPLGRRLDGHVRPDGLKVERVSVPIGTIFFIFESRPNVTIDGGALCFKSGNAVILRGGKEAVHSNTALARCFGAALKAHGVNPFSVQLVNTQDRKIIDLLLEDQAHVDLVIPRGGENLIRAVAEKSRVPVIKHYKGVCHVYVDKSADARQAEEIVLNAKVQRPGVCNAMETLLLDKSLEPGKIRRILDRLLEKKVTLRGDSGVRKLHAGVLAATAADWDEEYLDLILAVGLVDGVEGAVTHINRHGTGHTEAVVAKSRAVQKAFLIGVDSSSLMVNASTRFADGGEYGLGAEVGISTDKIHARGPMGVESLTTYRWIVTGNGHVRK